MKLFENNNKLLLGRLILLQNNYNILIFLLKIFKNCSCFQSAIHSYLKVFKYKKKHKTKTSFLK